MIIARWLTWEIFASIFKLIIKNRKANVEALYDSLQYPDRIAAHPINYYIFTERSKCF
jgi:hypothetical protein